MKKIFETYPGGKEGVGVAQAIINCIPPHKVFVEPFGGNFTLSRYINTPLKLINDKSWETYKSYPKHTPEFKFYNFDYKHFLLFRLHDKGLFVYCDPPYLMETRSSKVMIYDEEMTTVEEHTEFLNTMINCSKSFKIAISHYPCELYDNILKGWYYKDYESQTRAGKRTERLYMNYDYTKLTELQDFRYLGKNKTDRQRIKRKIGRWVAELKSLPILEQKAIVKQLKKAEE